MYALSASHLAPGRGFYEPQREYDWKLEVALDDAGDQMIIMESLESFDGIKVNMDETELHYGGQVVYIAGKARPQASNLKIKDFVNIGSANALLKWSRMVYNPETDSHGLARDYKKTADLALYAPDGSIVRLYKLVGCWPKDFDHGQFNMAGTGIVHVTVSLRYDRAIPGAGLNQSLSGINVGAGLGGLL